MKRLTSLLLSGVLALSLSVPAFAADHIACTYNSYTDTKCGLEMHFTEHLCTNGDRTLRVESKDRVVISHYDADTEVITVEVQENGETETRTLPPMSELLSKVDTPVTTKSGNETFSTSKTYTSECPYWDYSCYFNTARLSTSGIFWRMNVPHESTHSAYDQKDMSVRNIAEAYLAKLHDMNDNIHAANNEMISAGEAGLIGHVGAALSAYYIFLGGPPTAVALGAVISVDVISSVIYSVGAGIRSNYYWTEAVQYAQEAFMKFEEYRDLTEASPEESALFDVA